MYPTGTGTEYILSTGGQTSSIGYYILRDGNQFRIGSKEPWRDCDTGLFGNYSNNQWYYIVGDYDWYSTNAKLHYYVNGENIGYDQHDLGSAVTNTYPDIHIGKPNNVNNYYFTGTIDEVRISQQRRNAHWIAATYNNQIDPDFITVGQEETSHHKVLNVTASIDLGAGGIPEDLIIDSTLFYSYLTNTTTSELVFALYNYSAQEWNTIDVQAYDSFEEQSLPLSLDSEYYNEDLELLASFYAISPFNFDFEINELKTTILKMATIGPYTLNTDNKTQHSPSSYYHKGLSWTFLSNSSNNWAVEFTPKVRADYVSFSTLAADFVPVIYNEEEFQAYMSVYFDVNLKEFTNNLLEEEDEVRLVISYEGDENQYIRLDTGFEPYNLTNWLQSNIDTYYHRYLRHYYNLPLTDLTYSQVYAVDPKVQNNIYPFEVRSYYPIFFDETYSLRFNLVKDGWSMNDTIGKDEYRLGIDNIDFSFEITAKDGPNFQIPIYIEGIDNCYEYPSELYNYTTYVDLDIGTLLSGDLDSLKDADDEIYIIQAEQDSGSYKIDAIFEYGCDYPNFLTYPMDFYDLWVYLDYTTSNSSMDKSITLQGLTHDGWNYVWEDIVINSGEAVHLDRYYINLTFKFRLLAMKFC